MIQEGKRRVGVGKKIYIRDSLCRENNFPQQEMSAKILGKGRNFVKISDKDKQKKKENECSPVKFEGERIVGRGGVVII